MEIIIIILAFILLNLLNDYLNLQDKYKEVLKENIYLKEELKKWK